MHSFGAIRLRIAGVGSWKGGDTTGQNGSALARTSLGSGFWLAAGWHCLPVAMPSDESPRIRCGLVVAYADCHHSAVVAVFRRANDLSLMKEYANRQDVFDDARHNI